MVPLLVLMLPTTATCSILIKFNPAEPTDSSIHFEGSDISIINENEELAFQLPKDAIKDVIYNATGSRPDSVFFHRPTPPIMDWIYKSDDLTEVLRTLTAVGYEVVHHATEDLWVDSRHFNKSIESKVILSSKEKNFKNSIIGNWFGGVLDTKAQIYVQLAVPSFDNFVINSTWGVDFEMSRNVVFNKDIELSFLSNDDEQTAKGSLRIDKTVVKVIINYEATLQGCIACSFPEEFNGQSFLCVNVENILHEMGRPNLVKTAQMMTFEYYSFKSVVVKYTLKNKELFKIEI